MPLRAVLSRSARVPAEGHLDTRTDEVFLQEAYQTVLGRDIDASGRRFYGDLLRSGKSREAVLLLIATCEEAINRKLGQDFVVQDLRELRPERYQEVQTVDDRTVLTFRADSPEDWDWLERSMSEFGFFDTPGLWSLALDEDKWRMAEMLSLLAPRTALEVGCLSGAVLARLHDRGVAAVGVEAVPAPAQHAPLPVRHSIRRGDLLHADVEGPFDLVYGLHSFERTNPNRVLDMLQRAAELTAPGGFLFANVAAWGNDSVFGTIWEPYLPGWNEDLANRRMFDRILVDPDGYPLHAQMVWAGPEWWERQLMATQLTRVPEIERALHARFDTELEATPSRKAFMIFSAGASSNRIDEIVERIDSGAATVPGFAKAQFETIYEADAWQGGSGEGSLPEHTAVYRRLLHVVLGSDDVRSVVDVGCGDWQFSQSLDWSAVDYLGVDVVPSVVEENVRRHGADDVRFQVMDVLQEDPPPADLLIAKDVLQHWPNEEIKQFLKRMSGRYRYMLLTNDVLSTYWSPDQTNADIKLGAWRTLDLERAPFGLTALWRGDYVVDRGRWTKRVLLLGDPRHTRRPRSAALRLRIFGRRLLNAS